MTSEGINRNYGQAGSLVEQAARRLREEAVPYWASDQLPWRRLRTPYRVFLAEFLLVRTHTRSVAQAFEDIITAYPDLESLASADERELAIALKTLGLRKRVPLLKKAAQYLLKHFGAQVPRRIEDLIQVPGLGPYTAVAIAAFAYDSPEVPADVNILRFLSRLTGLSMEHPTKGSRDLRSLLPFLSRNKGGPKAETLLDFTRVVCRSRHPRCSECPVSAECTFFTSLVKEESEEEVEQDTAWR